MNIVGRDLVQLRTPELDIVTVWIVIPSLLDNVKAIQPASGHTGGSAPISPISAGVIIEQVGLEAIGPVPPIDREVDGEEGRDVLPAAVGDEAGSVEFAHVGVNEGISRLSVSP